MAGNSELWSGVAWLAAGVYVVWSGLDLGVGMVREPGSGFALFWLGLLMMVLAATVLAGGLRRRGPSFGELWAGTRIGRVAVVMALLVAYALALPVAGFVAATLTLLLVLMLLVDPVDWRVAVPVAVVATLGVWAALTKWLRIQLPAGPIDAWLG